MPSLPRKPTYRELVELIEAQQRRIAELEGLVEELRRRGKRQSAPFSKGTPKPNPKKPGRKAGKAYGRPATKPVPSKVDRHVLVQCPLFCPRCNGPVRVAGKADQYQTDLPRVKPVTTCKAEMERLDLEIGRLLVRVYRDPANRRLANHLSTLREDLFRFLLQPGLEGTNWAAETELRYAVVNRKTCGGGNRTEAGAAAQAILMTLSRTAKRRGHDDIALIADLLRAPKPVAHPLLLAALS